jgi:hypothetical protein
VEATLRPCGHGMQLNVAPIEGAELSCLDRRMHNIRGSLHSGNTFVERPMICSFPHCLFKLSSEQSNPFACLAEVLMAMRS